MPVMSHLSQAIDFTDQKLYTVLCIKCVNECVTQVHIHLVNKEEVIKYKPINNLLEFIGKIN